MDLFSLSECSHGLNLIYLYHYIIGVTAVLIFNTTSTSLWNYYWLFISSINKQLISFKWCGQMLCLFFLHWLLICQDIFVYFLLQHTSDCHDGCIYICTSVLVLICSYIVYRVTYRDLCIAAISIKIKNV